MKREDIMLGVKQVIAHNSRYTVDEIRLTDFLDRFISSAMKDRLAAEIKRMFRRVNTTSLTNSLFDVIKKVSQLVDHIDNIYNPPA
jgi:hypothetical protein